MTPIHLLPLLQLGKVAGKIKSILEFVKTEIDKHKVVKKAKVSQLLKWKFYLPPENRK